MENDMETGHELFIHGMNDMLDAERQLVEALQKLENDSSNSQLKKAFATHRQETEGQLERLQQCFELLGEEPEDNECKGIRGIIEEKKVFMEEDPSEDILDVFHVGAAAKAETYEICEYESLIDKAREMKHSKVAQLLRRNLKEEQATLRKMKGFSKEIKPEQLMSEEQEQKARAASGKSRRKRAA
jgi:ferritin-like metal-binding protein YciE